MTSDNINPIQFNLTRALYRKKEAADVLSISLSTLGRLVKSGKLKAPVKIGSENRFYATDLALYLAGLRDAA
jgi:excisionase family DNA binding protein